MSARERAIVDEKVPYACLKVGEAWNVLTKKEKLYAHYLSRASWWGLYILAEQSSPEAPDALKMFLNADLSEKGIKRLREAAVPSVATEEEFGWFLQFVAYFFSNTGNYNGFGDSKFLPRLPQEKFEAIIKASPNFMALKNYMNCIPKLYSFEDGEQMLGFPPEGVTGYYSPDMSREDAERVQRYLSSKGVGDGFNNRAFKTEKGYEIKLAAAEEKTLSTEEFEGSEMTITTGDYAFAMGNVVKELEKAKQFVANENQKGMIEKYIDSFRTGSLDDHKDSQRFWIKDQGPVIENNIGFIENYRDPLGVRGEWEGMVSCVNKVQSALYKQLVDQAEDFLKFMPWGKEFEKDKFLKPDYTSLTTINFACSGVPLGINIPNYDEIRQSEGFKNVTLHNVMEASAGAAILTFLSEADRQRYGEVKGRDREVQVACHELLGHGCGKQFAEDADGKRNFPDGLVNPVSKQPVASWYKPGETWSSVFTDLSNPLEECRAECAGLFLCLQDPVLELFGVSDAEDKKLVIWGNYLMMARGGVVGVERFNTKQGKWGQAHSCARFIILRHLIDSGVVELDWKKGADNIGIVMHEELIMTKGKEAIGNLLLRLNTIRATADMADAQDLWKKYATVEGDWLEKREVVLNRRNPRAEYVQSAVLMADGEDEPRIVEWPEGGVEAQIASFTMRMMALESDC